MVYPEHGWSEHQTLEATCPENQLEWRCLKEVWVDDRDTAPACPWLQRGLTLERRCVHIPRCLRFAPEFRGLRWRFFQRP